MTYNTIEQINYYCPSGDHDCSNISSLKSNDTFDFCICKNKRENYPNTNCCSSSLAQERQIEPKLDYRNIINLNKPLTPTSLIKSPSIIIKINDSHNHYSNNNQFFSLYSNCFNNKNDLFQQQLHQQQQKVEPESELKKRSFINFLIANIPAFGILCAMISVLCFSFNSVIVKLLKYNYGISGIQVLVSRFGLSFNFIFFIPLSFVSLFRAIFQFIVFGLVTLVKSRNSFFGVPGTRSNLVYRALTGTFSLCCIFTAFNMMPIGDATIIYFSSPVVVTVVAYFVLGEPFRLLQAITCILTIFGVGFISKPEFIFGHRSQTANGGTAVHSYPYLWQGQMLAIVAAIASAVTLVNLRKLKTTPASVVVFWFSGCIAMFGSVAIYLLDSYRPIHLLTDLLCTGLHCTICLMSVLEQYFLTIALKYEDATTISVTRSFNIVLAFIWEVVIFDEIITWTSLVGAVLVAACILLLAFNKSFLSTNDNNNTYNRNDKKIDLAKKQETVSPPTVIIKNIK